MWTRRTESRSLKLATAVSVVLWAAQAGAQDRVQQLEEVIVTGSLIEGTAEDAALPVEVITLDELDNLGRPSAIDLVKTMSEVGQSAGEADRGNFFPIGAATVNLRNLGSRYTTVVFNGRRFPEQYSVTTGRFNNISWIPQAAIGRIETLKQGGAVTYGADAIGGVVNYITRRDFDGLELNADYRYIDDSDGDYRADVLWGATFDRGNVMMVAGYGRRNTLMASDREFTQRHYLENNSPYSPFGSPGAYQFQIRGLSGNLTSIGRTTFDPVARYQGDRHISISSIMRDPYCTDLGGFAAWSATPSPVCYFREIGYEKLVEKSDTYQFYGELNYDLTDTVQLHTEATFYELDMPDIALSPSSTIGSWPAPGGVARQNVSGNPVYFVAGNNPAVGALMDAMLDSDGTPTFTATQRARMTDPDNPGRVSLPFGTWRPFGAGGHPFTGEYDIQQNNTKMYRLTAELKGDLPEFWGSSLGWTVAGTYSQVDYKVEAQDILVDRLQAALNGLGGPNCTGATPGANGCQWFNPFSSAIASNIYTGQVNPGFVESLANDPALVDWLYVPISLDRTYSMVVADVLVSGETGWELPGGPVSMALGAQFRRTDEEFVLDPLSNRDINPCPTPGETACSTESGPLAMTRNVGVLGTTQNVDRYYPVAAAFFEAQLPLHDTVTVQLASRYEKFYSDTTDVDNDVFVPAGAIKWQPLPWLAARASLGRTFSQVNPPEDDGVTEGISATNNDFGGFGGADTRYDTFSYDNVNIKSEESTYYNVGFITQLDRFSASVDYFYNKLEEGTRTLGTDALLRALIAPGEAPGLDALINCSSPLFTANQGLGGNPIVVLNTDGQCIQGQSTLSSGVDDNGVPDGAAAGLAGGALHYFGGLGQTNGGVIEQSGIDFNMSYYFDLFGGTLRPSVDLSYFLNYDYEDFELFGVKVAEGYDAIGFINAGPGRLLQAAPEWRGSLGLNYNHGRHTFNLLARYIPSVINDDAEDFEATNATNANIGGANGFTTGPSGVCPATGGLTSDLGDVPAGAGSGEFGVPSGPFAFSNGFCETQNTALQSYRKLKESFNIDLTYRVELPQDIQMSLSIYNLTDETPVFSRTQLSYSAFFGSPLQRNYRLSFRKRF